MKWYLVVLVVFCLAAGGFLLWYGVGPLNPQQAIYTGTITGRSQIQEVQAALLSPQVQVVEYKHCTFGVVDTVKFKVLVPNSDCPFPYGAYSSGSNPQPMMVSLVFGAILAAVGVGVALRKIAMS